MSSPSANTAPTTTRPRRPLRIVTISAVVTAILILLFGVPWWTLVAGGPNWPTPVVVVGTLIFALALVGLPASMFLSYGRVDRDGLHRVGDTLIGVVWVVFVWSVLGYVLRLTLMLFGVDDPVRSRISALATIVVSVALVLWGYREAMRVPRVKYVDVVIPRLGAGLDELRVVAITDTHYGPINRAQWSQGVVDVVNELDADIVAHVGDIADGTVDQRREQAAPLATVRSKLANVYVTGNHEYLHEAQGWLDHMDHLGWETLHNKHIVIERGGDRLVVAGVDDATARGSRQASHGADFGAALAGTDPTLPVLMLAHQPKQVTDSVAAGVDLQIAGHTHGGQIWPFNMLVKLDQPSVHGLSRHGERTQLYTSRGSGFWGPPLRVFAPSEITVLTLRRS
ncbi:metallophosphoesterase [Rhodococcus sp. 27YEA15]|uniref:metallophosphoesterase n=1 Tax=Rhodococcus sp. 27YEA15 TaxID=3156259 RepID=UPI003C7EB242